MKYDLNQEDIKKILKWKGSENPSDEYFARMRHDILKEIQIPTENRKFDVQRQTSWWSIFKNIRVSPIIGISGVCLVIVALQFWNPSTKEPNIVIDSNDTGVGIRSNLTTNSSNSRPPLDITTVSTDGEAVSTSITGNLTNKANPHFPFQESVENPNQIREDKDIKSHE